jgi:hypothetical protein
VCIHVDICINVCVCTRKSLHNTLSANVLLQHFISQLIAGKQYSTRQVEHVHSYHYYCCYNVVCICDQLPSNGSCHSSLVTTSPCCSQCIMIHFVAHFITYTLGSKSRLNRSSRVSPIALCMCRTRYVMLSAEKTRCAAHTVISCATHRRSHVCNAIHNAMHCCYMCTLLNYTVCMLI